MKLLPVLLVCVCSLVLTRDLQAETVSHRLTPANIDDQLLSFTVKVERLKDNELGKHVQFHVTVKAKAGKAPLLPRRSGTLTVFDGKKFVSSREVRPTERGGELSYSFQVAPTYLSGSAKRF